MGCTLLWGTYIPCVTAITLQLYVVQQKKRHLELMEWKTCAHAGISFFFGRDGRMVDYAPHFHNHNLCICSPYHYIL